MNNTTLTKAEQLRQKTLETRNFYLKERPKVLFSEIISKAEKLSKDKDCQSFLSYSLPREDSSDTEMINLLIKLLEEDGFKAETVFNGYVEVSWK